MAQKNIANVDSSAANDATVKAQTNAVAMPTFTNAEAPRDGQAYLATAQTALQPQTVTDNPRSPTARQVPTNNAAQPLSSVRPVDLPASPQSQSQVPTAEPTPRPLKPTPLPPSHASTSIATSIESPSPISNPSTITNNVPIPAPATPTTINHTLSLDPSKVTVVKNGSVAAGFPLVVSGTTFALQAGAANIVIGGTATAGPGGTIVSGLGIAASTASGNGSVVAFTGGASQLADGEGLSWWIGVVVGVGAVYLRLGL